MKKTLMLSAIAILAAIPAWSQTTTPAPTPTSPPAGAAMEKVAAMTPAQRETFLANHPELKERWQQREMQLDKLQAMTPDQRQQFLQNHPKVQQFINNHPVFAQKLANGAEAGPGIKDPGHPRVNEVNQREQNQQNRIAQGVNKGTLNAQQTANLEKGESKIQQKEADDLQKNDGHLTKPEERQLNGEENRESDRIYRDKR